MFSARTDWDLTPNRLAALTQRLQAAGDSILDLTVSNPTQVGISYPVRTLLRALSLKESLRHDPHPQGLPSARLAVCDVFRDRGVVVDPRDLFLTSSTSEAYAWLFKLLINPGEEVLVPSPSYPLFEYLARLEDACPVAYPLIQHQNWEIDFSFLERAISPRTRAIVVVSPNNPTGSFLKKRELRRLTRLCRGKKLALIGDEVFSEYARTAEGERVSSLLTAEGVLVFSLGGFSKLIGMPQVKLGWIALGGPRPLKDGARRRLELIADTYLSVNAPVQHAAPRLLQAGRAIRRRIQKRVDGNEDRLARMIRNDSACRVMPREGGWTAILQVPAVMSEEDWVMTLLKKDRVLAHPGYFYGFNLPAFLVLSLLPPEEVFVEGVRRVLARGNSF